MTARTPKARRTVLIGLSVASLVGVAAVSGVVGGGPASADVVEVNPYANLIVLETGATNQASYYPAAGGSTHYHQPLTNSKQCLLSPTSASDPLVLNLSGSATVGLNGGSLGIIEKGTSKGQACGQVNILSGVGESLTVSLPVQKDGKTVSALFAVLDLEVQKDVIVKAVTMGSAGSETFYLHTGLSKLPDPLPADYNYTQCKVGSTSSAPNSGPSDNCKWQISGQKKFNQITLTAMGQGQFSLEGGVDWPGGSSARSGGVPTNATYFYLGEPCSADASTLYIDGGETGPDAASYTRDAINADGSLCLSVDPVLGTDEDGLFLLKSAGQPFEQGIVRAPWVATPGADAINETEINFVPKNAATIGDGSFEAGWTTMPWCPASLWANPGGLGPRLTGIPSDADAAATELLSRGLVDQDTRVKDSATDNKLFQYSCVYDRDVQRQVDGTYKTVESIYLLGDAYWRG